VRSNPHEYACIGCEQKLSNHETIFETRKMRVARGATVDEEYYPFYQLKGLKQNDVLLPPIKQQQQQIVQKKKVISNNLVSIHK
jgi:hypothetical protein